MILYGVILGRRDMLDGYSFERNMDLEERSKEKQKINTCTLILKDGTEVETDFSNLYLYSMNTVKVVIYEGIEVLEESVFNGFRTVNEIILPESIVEILDFAFANCHNLTKINIPKSCIKIGKSAFFNCFSLQRIVLLNVLEIDNYAFLNSGLEEIVIMGDIREISRSSFNGCKNLKYFVISDSCIFYDWQCFFEDCQRYGIYVFKEERYITLLCDNVTRLMTQLK